MGSRYSIFQIKGLHEPDQTSHINETVTNKISRHMVLYLPQPAIQSVGPIRLRPMTHFVLPIHILYIQICINELDMESYVYIKLLGVQPTKPAPQLGGPTRIRSTATAIKCPLFIIHSYSLFQIKGLDEPDITSNVLQAVIKLH